MLICDGGWFVLMIICGEDWVLFFVLFGDEMIVIDDFDVIVVVVVQYDCVDLFECG